MRIWRLEATRAEDALVCYAQSKSDAIAAAAHYTPNGESATWAVTTHEVKPSKSLLIAALNGLGSADAAVRDGEEKAERYLVEVNAEREVFELRRRRV